MLFQLAELEPCLVCVDLWLNVIRKIFPHCVELVFIFWIVPYPGMLEVDPVAS